jgi:spore maturation protein CgeB
LRILYVTSAYPELLSTLPHFTASSFSYLEEAFYHNSFSWADFWIAPMSKLGVEFWQITTNYEPLQRCWEYEKFGSRNLPLREIVVRQAVDFKPDVLFIDDYDINLLNAIKENCPSIRLSATWTGSALAPIDFMKHVDVVLTCAPEAQERLNFMGIRAEHLNHMFAPAVLERLSFPRGTTDIDASFIGQILPGSDFHLKRMKLVASLIPSGLTLYSPPWSMRTHLSFYKSKMRSKYFPISFTDYIRICMARQPPCFGLKMYETLIRSRITLNVHADSSPRYASNMRLFEATGVGCCLLTDWKANIRDLFEPDFEIVTYKSAEECREKLDYLLAHPSESEKIAQKGRERCLKDHSVESRADKMVQIFRKYI